MSRSKGVKAWVVYWELQCGRPLPIAQDSEVVGVLPPTWGRDRVCDVLERLYLERAMTSAELVQWRRVGASPYPPECGTYLHGVQVVDLEYFCGHNPILKARKVEKLISIGEHELRWEEVGVTHRSELCAAAGVPDCELAGQEPRRVTRSWRAS